MLSTRSGICSIPCDVVQEPAVVGVFETAETRTFFSANVIMQVLCEMVDFTLLARPPLFVYACMIVLAMLAFHTPYIYLGMRSTQLGIAEEHATLLLSCIGRANNLCPVLDRHSNVGISNTFGRIFFGWFADRQWMTSLNISSLALLSCAAANFALIATSSYVCAIIYANVFGFFAGRCNSNDTLLYFQLPSHRSYRSCSCNKSAWKS
jgi:predicted MFS family arabinose efflux permease